MEYIQKAMQLKADLDDLRPINKDQEARIMQKFRLDWNYHSNHLEGNSYTYGETKALILNGLTANGKPLKDQFEMLGHNEALKWILEVVKEDFPLTEVFIRQLHTLLLVNPYEVNAITAEGQPTKKRVEIGKYKSLPNHVQTVTGEIFYFATPEETPAKMEELINWFREKKNDMETNPILLAAEFHYRFIRIHPFDDGNGRTARILMNFILMQYGYPPVIIKTEDKINYFAALQQGDAGFIEQFIEYIAQNLVRSLEIMIAGANGENIEEPDDIDKEIALLDQRINAIEDYKSVKKERSVEAQNYLFEVSFNSLLDLIFPKLEKFNKFFGKTTISLENKHTKKQLHNLDALKDKLKYFLTYTNYDEIKIVYYYNYLTKLGLVHYDLQIVIAIKFEQFYYKVGFGYIENNLFKIFNFYEKLYHQVLNSDEIQQSLKSINDFVIKKIEIELEKNDTKQ